jgi:AraC-like DNA-binding protein
MQHLEVPERAIQAFEKIHRLRVTVHDLRGTLTLAIGRDRFQHRDPLCKCVKAGGGERHCAGFEILRLRADIHAWPGGRYHVCHAGLLEWMTPVYDDLELEWVLFAGVRTPGPDLGAIHREPLTRWARPPWDARTRMPIPVGRAEADLILEHLLQVAARLREWAWQRNRQLPPKQQHGEGVGNSLLIRRRTLIRRYIESNHSNPIRLRDLAAELKVGEDRATHLIRECCGQTFREILIEARLKTARELLRLSSLPILEVALCSGFSEISHFNRIFRRRVGCAPNQYRRKGSP